ncbi:TIGR02466 family protein [Tabrizicola sp.]|uniref:TIGR02466 family protein n=1 Tax=Tabrizicola sp. TaxID=2005166 RepID=UPI00286B5F5D|nr:TIGR02466 family protein [Tabrizicola sp.]
MLDLVASETLFSTPLLRFSLADHAVLDAELLAEGERQRAVTEGVAKSNRGGWHSEGNIFDSDTPCIVRLRQAAEASIWEAVRRMKGKADPATLSMKLSGWMNMNPKGGFNAPHTHPGAHWSGVYYVAQPAVETGNSGMIEFLDPRSDLPHWRLFEAKAFRPKRKIRPAAGEIVLFPSYLVHWVYPNETDVERVTVAFNATFRSLAD